MKKEVDPAVLYNESEPVWVKNGDVVKLEHVSTGKSLHSHDIRPPVTDVEYQNEVRYVVFINSIIRNLLFLPVIC